MKLKKLQLPKTLHQIKRKSTSLWLWLQKEWVNPLLISAKKSLTKTLNQQNKRLNNLKTSVKQMKNNTSISIWETKVTYL